MLRHTDTNCVIDVRSVPMSSYNPQFNKEPLSRFLRLNGIQYAHFGEEFGARRTDCIVDGQVNFEKAIETDAFLRGFSRLKVAIEKGFVITLLCSEANPLACHRFSLISRFLVDNGLTVKHILHTDELISHEALEREMIDEYVKKGLLQELSSDTLWAELDDYKYSDTQQRDDAYRLKNKEIGYRVGEQYQNLD